MCFHYVRDECVSVLFITSGFPVLPINLGACVVYERCTNVLSLEKDMAEVSGSLWVMRV